MLLHTRPWQSNQLHLSSRIHCESQRERRRRHNHIGNNRQHRTTIISRPVLSRVHSPVEFDGRDLDLVSWTYGLTGGACGLCAVLGMAAWVQLLPSLEAWLPLFPRLAVRAPLAEPAASARSEQAMPVSQWRQIPTWLVSNTRAPVRGSTG